ncbi:rho guanine nucleotide exchange factor 7 isoform X7 [Agrilus planipennis]|uniref:Rho guanine nucleotide exchange factor 7 isoform X7 n=1 Tax=Agrilus planipennis TaxID=224129 RepID=A0A1W4X8U4_AGRPL|nr:rho guanine nucleotide exchange factor 7 isoform X7 [Agrilus planipennis]
MSSQPMTVQAVYSFKGKNNDELCFKKGDKIVITQKEEGGWWEGTLGDKTGWFPSNYVVECKDVHTNLAMVNQQKQYRSVVLKDLIDSEKAHVTEQQGLVSNFLQPLEKSSILSVDEYRQLTGNLLEVLDTHQQLLHLLEEEESKTSEEQRVGRLFLTWAPKMKSVHQGYCSLHPKAAFILDKYKDELTTYMESCGATTPGVLVLTVGLSKPFRRLEKYSGMLQELERHLEESHPDRGDTQRSVSVYKEIATSCAAIRRQKELELQVLTGPVRGWEGQSLSTLGEIIYMGSVAVGPQHHDRYLVLFPSTLLILSVSPRLSAFIYEGKLPLTGINVIRLEDSDQYKNAFEINGHLIEKRTAVCQSKEEADRWVEILRKHMPHRSNVNSFNQKALPSQAEVVPQPPPHMSPLTTGTGTSNSISRQGSGINPSTRSTPSPQSACNNGRGWSVSCLRPTPPLRPCLALGVTVNGSPGRSSRKPITYKEDALILDVIEAYCGNVKPRNTVNSVDVGTNYEGCKDIESLQTIKNLSDIVQTLQNQFRNLEANFNTLSYQFMEERSARCKLQNIIKNNLGGAKEVETIEWPTMESNIFT